MRAIADRPCVAVLAAAFVLAAGCENGGGSPDRLLDPNEATALIDEHPGDPNFVILDVRTPVEYAQGHLEGAVNINYYDSDFESQIAALDHTVTYLVYCQSGGRSASATALMLELGFVDVYELDGGITAWIDAGYPVVP